MSKKFFKKIALMFPYFRHLDMKLDRMYKTIERQEKELDIYRDNKCSRLPGYQKSEGAVSAHHIKNEKANIDSTLYVRAFQKWEHICDKDYHMEGIPQVQTVDKGIILPLIEDKANPHLHVGGFGGVCDPTGAFVAGHKRGVEHSDTSGGYPVSGEPDYIPETVVYAGLYLEHFGHYISECLARLWWYVENKGSKHKCVFISHAPHINEKFYELLELLGIPENRVILCKNPTRFDCVIVPEHAFIFGSGYTEKAKTIFNALRDSVKPEKYEKIYLTKTKYPGTDVINEEFFEGYFLNHGYKVISPEFLPVKEQIALMAGAKEIVCVSGTLGHQLVFCPDNTNITILHKNEVVLIAQCWINQLRKAKCTLIDVSVNFLPSTLTGSSFLLMPTVYWRKYLLDRGASEAQVNDTAVDYKRYVYDYIKMWAQRMLEYADTPEALGYAATFTIADIIIDINELLLNEELDEYQKKKLRDVFVK